MFSRKKLLGGRSIYCAHISTLEANVGNTARGASSPVKPGKKHATAVVDDVRGHEEEQRESTSGAESTHSRRKNPEILPKVPVADAEFCIHCRTEHTQPMNGNCGTSTVFCHCNRSVTGMSTILSRTRRAAGIVAAGSQGRQPPESPRRPVFEDRPGLAVYPSGGVHLTSSLPRRPPEDPRRSRGLGPRAAGSVAEPCQSRHPLAANKELLAFPPAVLPSAARGA